MKSDPQQKIHRITNTFPNNPASPFYAPRPMTPLARLTIRRIHPKPGASPGCHGNETDLDIGSEIEGLENTEDTSALSDMERKKLMMMKQGRLGWAWICCHPWAS